MCIIVYAHNVLGLSLTFRNRAIVNKTNRTPVKLIKMEIVIIQFECKIPHILIKQKRFRGCFWRP